MLYLAGRGVALGVRLWPLWLWWLCWWWGGQLADGTVYARSVQVALPAALFVPALVMTAHQLAPGWVALAAAAGSMLAGYLGFAAEQARLWPYFARSGYSLSYIAPYLDYPLLLVSALAMLAPPLVPFGRWISNRQSGRRTGGPLGSARWMSGREARTVFAEGDLIVGEAPGGLLTSERPALLRFDGSGHLLTVAGSGSGKSVSVAIPNCLSWQGSLIAHDPKGELARLCGPARRADGRDVYVLDPGSPDSDSLNVLDWLDPAEERVVDDARLVVSWLTGGAPPGGENSFFEERARALVLMLLLFVVCGPGAPAEERNLESVRILSQLPNLRELLQQLVTTHQTVAYGVAAGIASEMLQLGEGRTWTNIVSTAHSLLDCLKGPVMGRLVSGTGRGRRLSTADLASNRIDVFIAVPVKDLDANPSIARLLLGSLLNTSFERGRARKADEPRTLFLLDEMPRLRRMELLETARDIGRGHGIVLWAIVQDLGQLRKYYHEDGVTSWIENSQVKSFFGIGSFEAAEMISKMIGEQTVTVRSKGREHPLDPIASSNDQPQSRLLITPDEIMRMAIDADGVPDEQILIMRNRLPLRCGMAKWYRRHEMRQRIEAG